MAEPLLIAKSAARELALLPQMANRHGLVAGATGTGKTVTLQVLAESLSAIGVPVFVADVKGDLSGIGAPGGGNAKVEARARELGLEPAYAATPVVFWDVFGAEGHPVRTTVSELGPLFLSRILGLNETQTAVLSVAFRVADDAGLLLLDLKDLRAMLQHVGEHARELALEYGNVSSASVGAIQRALLVLEDQEGERLFGEPALDVEDLLATDAQGRGIVSVLAAAKLVRTPRTYATFLLFLLAEIFERLPEVGDPEKPRLVFFFDEAHLLFDGAPAVLREKIEQVVRLVRSKGVGVWFVTQNPLDLPDEVLGQLGNRVQHALRAFTPRDQKAVRAAAETFRTNPSLDAETAITELAVGEALVSFLDEKGRPGIVERALVRPPRSRIGPLAPDERSRLVQRSAAFGRYERLVDRESAYEVLKGRAERAAAPAEAPPPRERADETAAGGSGGDVLGGILFGRRGPRGGRGREGVVEAMAKSAARSIGSSIGRQILRGLFGSMLGGRRR